jgi:phospholipid transport system transporter-binding protein
MTSIILQGNEWHVSGEILMDNANAVLTDSNAFKIENDLNINLSAVTDVDTAALSLLLEWQRRALAANKKVTFTHLPESLMSLATLYGVAEFIPATSS